MKVLVLGSAAHGGYARWVCGCARCERSRPLGEPGHQRTRSALAVSADGTQWALVNASPDIGRQLGAHPELVSPGGLPLPIRAVVLTSADIDCVGGLLTLRDGPPLDVYATPSVFEDLTDGLPVLSVLQHYCGVRWHLLGVAGEQRACTFEIEALEPLRFEAIASPGPLPPYSAHRNDPSPGDHIAIGIVDPVSNRRLVYAPGIDLATAVDAVDWLGESDCLLLDGGDHVAGEEAMSARERTAKAVEPPPAVHRRVLLHLPSGDRLLDAESPERRRLASRGIEVGYDGMQIQW